MGYRFDNTVVLVTGSSRGLGKEQAKMLGSLGATVVVNSTGKDDAGSQVVQEIEAQGGQAFDLKGQVEDAPAIVTEVIERFHRLDGIVHNAGFIRDKTVAKMAVQDWDAVLAVHLKSAFLLSQAAWPFFIDQGYGRIVFLSSSAGLYGNFGQANYAAAKMGMYGLCRSIAIEGKKFDISCNCIAPFGVTDMNRQYVPEAVHDTINPAYVAPLVAYLIHQHSKESGSLFEASAGSFKKLRWERSQGISLDASLGISVDDIADNWDAINDFTVSEHPQNMGEALAGLYQHKLG